MKDDVPHWSLYDSQFEHDACGVGFVADIPGRKSHNLLRLALQALTRLAHRGAIDADGKTGDGAGVLLQIPHRFFQREIYRLAGAIPDGDEIAVGVFFLPWEESSRSCCRAVVEEILKKYGFHLFGWRPVPVRTDALGAKAVATMPRIEQALIAAGNYTTVERERSLYLVRKELERRLSDIEDFYIPSLSSRTIVYKGMLAAAQLAAFYPDLNTPDFETALVVFHQRYSTNTFPNWALAQPFRALAHNGEINTIAGNRNWMRAREAELTLSLWQGQVEIIKPVIWEKGSDSASLDNAVELLEKSGRDILHSMMMLLPEAYENARTVGADLRGFYEYSAGLTEAWDGPAAVAFSDGIIAGAVLDRNGLRPARYAVTSGGLFILASEAGVIDLAPEEILEKGRLAPGKMIAVDTERGVILKDAEIKRERAARNPYADWVRRAMLHCPSIADTSCGDASDEVDLTARMKAFGYTLEDIQRILRPMLEEAKEPVGSMGDDTPLAVLSAKPRLLYHYFKQRFAQITNPAIDPLRERAVMSLETLLGKRESLFEETEAHARLIKLHSPVLTDNELEWIRNADFSYCTLKAFYNPDGEDALEKALDTLCQQAGEAVEQGHTMLILSDRGVSERLAPVPMLLAVAAVHHHLIRQGKRMRVSLIAETGEAREEHHVACLIGYGASAVNPYLAFEIVAQEVSHRGMSAPAALKNYKTAIENGLLKIMAKVGIVTISSYCGAQIFEAVGLCHSLLARHFTGTPGKIGGLTLREIARDYLQFHASAFTAGDSRQLEDAGFYRYRVGGEYHGFNPSLFRVLHKFVKRNDTAEYKNFSAHVVTRPPVALRDLLDFRYGEAVPVAEVEVAEEIMLRFSTSAMSLGALSPEAHETLAIAMNRIGARSNSGEGGEARSRYRAREDGDSANSRVKQIASARFGVTPEYLVFADELEIKISQGAKPGEGGQLPGHKVTAEIAALRHSVPGVTLISPPPHHDIYSIEDLAQLIFDLKQINPRARIAVKLVSEAGVGTIAAGVAKAHADVIHIAGHDGGTGAAPLGSIKNAGSPWELGLAETQQTLVLNNLRSRVRLRVDGGIKSGRDVVMAAMFGAEEFGFATSALVALGCVMARQCHLNTCPVGIATQEKGLRERYAGKPEMVANYFTGVAEEVRDNLSQLGFRSLDEIIGRVDLLTEREGVELAKKVKLDLRALLYRGDETPPRKFITPRSAVPVIEAGRQGESLNRRVLMQTSRAVFYAIPMRLAYPIQNTDRTTGANLAGEIAALYGDTGLPEATIDLHFHGCAGQSFGAFTVAGMRLTLTGEANDTVGKGMSGGMIIIRPPDETKFNGTENVIIGNTVLYGATGGSLFAAGGAGERFGVRNSGATAVVESTGEHACEYMTAGVIVVLGEVGRNFAAGMTGGTAFVLDTSDSFAQQCNQELVTLEVLNEEPDLRLVRSLVEQHFEWTGSRRARDVLWNWESYRHQFWKVITQGARAQKLQAKVEQIVALNEEGRRAKASKKVKGKR